MRILVLGSGDGARDARRFISERNLPLARHALDSVGCVVTDETVEPRDARVLAARAVGVRVVGHAEFIADPQAAALPAAGPFHPRPHRAGRPSSRARRAHPGQWDAVPRPADGGAVTPHHPAGPPLADQAARAVIDWSRRVDPAAFAAGARTAASMLWALTPALTAGFAAPILFGHAAAKLKSVVAGAAAFLYTGLLAAAVAYTAADLDVLAAGHAAEANPLGAVSLLAVVLASTTHAFIIRDKVFPPRAARPREEEAPAEDENSGLERLALEKRRRRHRARVVLEEDPALAEELHIGRPDLGGDYDDGGLVDVNRAPASALAAVRGLDEQIAERIVALRAAGPFVSTEDLVVRADLDPSVLAVVDEYAVYR